MSDFIEFYGSSIRKDAIIVVNPVYVFDGGDDYHRDYYYLFDITVNATTLTSLPYHTREDASTARSKLLRDLDPNPPL